MRIQSQRDTFARIIEAYHIEDEPDQPHMDWKTFPNYKNAETRDDLTPEQKQEVYHQWHPPFGESHVEYHIYPSRQPDGTTRGWHTEHNGTYQGMKTIGDPGGNTWTHPHYQTKDNRWGISHELGKHATPEEGMALAEKHYQQNYGAQSQQPSIGDYDINEIMRQQGF